MKELKVVFKGKSLKYKDTLTIEEVNQIPKIKFNKNSPKAKEKLYTIMMVDADAPSIKNPINKYWLHWLVVNNNNILTSFKPANPPMGTGPHRYYIYLFEQSFELNLQPINERAKFKLKDFIVNNQLKLIAFNMYIVENIEKK